jgi:hypothetical protein
MLVLAFGILAFIGQIRKSKNQSDDGSLNFNPSGTTTPNATELPDPHAFDGILNEPPQAQAEDLLQAAVNHREGAADLLTARAESYRGSIQATQRLNDLDLTARYGTDLRTRVATTELMLAAFNYTKTEATAERLIAMADHNPDGRAHDLWVLGMLANRGVEPSRILGILQSYASDSDAQAAWWALEGIAITGMDEAIPVLLDIAHNNPSVTLHQRAGCGLAKSGGFTQAQRMQAVPKLIEYAEKNDVDAETRGYYFQALHEITNVNLPSDPAAWRTWLQNDGKPKPYGAGKPWSINGNS